MLWESWDKRPGFLLILMGAFVAGLAFLYLWQGTVLARLRAERAALVLSLEELRRQHLFWEHQLQAAYSLEILSARARALGMGPVDLSRLHYLVIGDGDGH